MNFKELMQQLESRLGYHQIPLNPAARGIKDIFENGPLHHDLVTRLVKAIFTENKCQRLEDAVAREATFRALSPIRLEAIRSNSTDVDLFNLVDDLCRAVERIFAIEPGGPPGGNETPEGGTKPSAEIIPLEPFLRERRLKSWA
jgi:hypothetical protein